MLLCLLVIQAEVSGYAVDWVVDTNAVAGITLRPVHRNSRYGAVSNSCPRMSRCTSSVAIVKFEILLDGLLALFELGPSGWGMARLLRSLTTIPNARNVSEVPQTRKLYMCCINSLLMRSSIYDKYVR